MNVVKIWNEVRWARPQRRTCAGTNRTEVYLLLMERSRLVLLDAGVLHTVAQEVPSLALPTAMALPLVHPAHRASEKGQRLEETQAFLESHGPETTQHFLSFVYHSCSWPCLTPKEPVKGVIVGNKRRA